MLLLGYAFIFKRSTSSVSVGQKVLSQVDENSVSKSPLLRGDAYISTLYQSASAVLKSVKDIFVKTDDINLETWMKWVVAPVKGTMRISSDISISIDGKLIKGYPFGSLERKTDSLAYDLRMKFFSELVSIDDKGNYLPPVVFKIGSLYGEHYGAVPFAVSLSVLDRVEYVKSYVSPLKDIFKYRKELIQAFSSLYFTLIGRPAHNSFAVPWSAVGPEYSFVQQNLQAYLWYVLDKEVGILKYPVWRASCSPAFPLPEDVNSKLSDKRGFPKVRVDGSSRMILDSDSIGTVIFQQGVDKKFFNGKLSVYSELIKKNKEKSYEK